MCPYVLEWVDALRRLLNLATKHLRDQLLSQLGEIAASSFLGNKLHHLLADCTNLGGLCICRLLDLIWSLLGKADEEDANQVFVGGLDHHVGFDQRLPLAHERTQLVRSEVEAVEVGQTVLALNLVYP